MAQRRLVEIVLQGKDQTSGAFNQLGLNLDQNKMKALAFAGAAAAVAAGAAKAAEKVYDFADEMASLGDDMEKMAARTGVVVEELSALDFAVERSGGTTADMETGVRRLARAMGDAIDGVREAKDSFADLGISTGDLVGPDGQLVEISDILPQIADGLQELDSQAARMDIAQALLGRGGTRLLPALQGGSEALAALNDELERYGGTMSTEFAAKSAAFVDATTNLATATQRLKEELAEPLLAPFTAAINALAETIADAKDLAEGIRKPSADRQARRAGAAGAELGPGGAVAYSVEEWQRLVAIYGQENVRLVSSEWEFENPPPTVRPPSGPRNYGAPASAMDPRYAALLENRMMGFVPVAGTGADSLMSGWDPSLFGEHFEELNQEMFIFDDRLLGLSETMPQLSSEVENASAIVGTFAQNIGYAVGTGLGRALLYAESFSDAFVAIMENLFVQLMGMGGQWVLGSIVPGLPAAGKAATVSNQTKAMPSPTMLGRSGAGLEAAAAAAGKAYV